MRLVCCTLGTLGLSSVHATSFFLIQKCKKCSDGGGGAKEGWASL